MRRALRFLYPHRRALGIAVASACALAVFSLGGPYFLRQLTDTAIQGEYTRFGWLVAASFALALLQTVSTYFEGSSVAALRSLAVRDLRISLTSRVQRLPLPTLSAYHSGDLVSRFNNDLDQVSALFARFPDYFYQPLRLLGGLAFLLWISPKLTLVICISMPISVYIFDRVVRPMQQHAGDKMEALAAANATLQDAIRGAPIVRAFGLQRLLGARFETQARDVEHHDRKRHVRDMLSFIPFLTLRYIPQLLVPIYGGWMAFRGEISVGDLLAVNWLIWPVFLPLEAFLAWIRELREAAPALQRTYELLDAPAERTSGRAVEPASSGIALAFDAVTFGYNADDRVLDGLTFQVEVGETIALVGASGCGKTTILRLLCGLVDPSGGTVNVFGVPYRELSLASVREHLSLMAQDAFLFPTSVAENIGYGKPSASREKIVEAARAAQADEFIQGFPNGYEHSVGELGGKLSGGQRQRICLARMILKDAPILLLDEPTAALDAQSEAAILDALDPVMAKKTTFIVSHRLSTLRSVDRILVLENGRIRASGTHDELLAADPVYRRLAQRQIHGQPALGATS